MGRDVPVDDYEFWVQAFHQAFDTTEFNSLQRDLGLIPFNHAGDAAQREIAATVLEMRQVAIEMGLIQ